MPALSVSSLIQVVVALGLVNVWLIRPGKATSYRGGSARSLKEEFAEYGLPSWAFPVVGTLKLGVAAALLIGLWVPALVLPAAALLVVLMLGAIAMHVKVRDPAIRALPATLMLAMGAGLVILKLQ